MYPQSSLQKRVEKQKEHANRNLASWFLRKFSKKTQYLRDQDEESAQADRLMMRRHGPQSTSNHSHSGSTHSNTSSQSASHAKPRHISAVAAARAQDSELARPTPQRQRSFLRAQLLEMKRESAETLLQVQQKRMAGEVVKEVPRFGTQLGIDNSDDEDYVLDESDDDLDSVRSVEELDEALQELSAAEFRAIRKEKWLLKKSRMMDAANEAATRMDRARSGSSQRRSSHGSSRTSGTTDFHDDDDDDDEHDESDKENDASTVELNRRISRATQMYAEALSQIDHALHPSDHPVEPQPLYLGGKKSGHRPKSEWI